MISRNELTVKAILHRYVDAVKKLMACNLKIHAYQKVFMFVF